MPPRTVKRGGASGPRRNARAARGTAKQQQPDVTEEAVKVEEVSVKNEEKPVLEDDKKPIVVEDEPKSDVNGLVPAMLSKFCRFSICLILIQI